MVIKLYEFSRRGQMLFQFYNEIIYWFLFDCECMLDRSIDWGTDGLTDFLNFANLNFLAGILVANVAI
jgi:hypothetical protein